MKSSRVVIHYGEITLKGKNKNIFVNALVKNIKDSLKDNIKSVKTTHGKVVVNLNENFNEDSEIKIAKRLSMVPGVANFHFSISVPNDIESIKLKAKKLVEGKNFKSFKVKTQRSNKKFPLKSPEVSEIVGHFINEKQDKIIDLKNPDITIFVEIANDGSFIYLEKHKGIGGLPTGSISPLICSLSGGIDSPVAAYHMIKRGSKVVLVHFHNKTINAAPTLSKIESLAKQLSNFQNKSKLLIVPFDEIQKAIIASVPGDSRMIVYRRFMMKILNKIANELKIDCIVTGDNLGQVASQTPENIKSIYEASELPILTPLAGDNKHDIVNTAMQIGTFEISTLPYEDCCSFMIDNRPKTKTKIVQIKALEKKIPNKEELIDNAVKNLKEKEF